MQEEHVAAAALPSAAASRAWLPAKAQLGIKRRLFSKNILRSGDLWARGTATWTSTIICAALFIVASYLVYLRLASGQSSPRQRRPIWKLASVLADQNRSNQLDDDLNGDEYEDEEESARSGGFLASSRERQTLRKIFGKQDHTLNKRSSIVRIVSSDPTSTLSEHPMQVDLEPNTRRSFWPAPSPLSGSSDSASSLTSPSDPDLSAKRSSSLLASPTPGAATRRARLPALEHSRRQHSASPSPSRSPLSSGAALPTRPTRSRPVDARSPLGRRGKRNSTSSLSSTGSPASAPTKIEDGWTDVLQTPVKGLTGNDDDPLLATPSTASEASFTSAVPGHESAFMDDEAPSSSECPSPTSSTFSIRAPSILKRRPQTFRTASLREIDISYSLMQRKASLPIVPMLGPYGDPTALQQQQELWQTNGVLLPFAAPPPYQSASPEATDSADSAFPRPKSRSIKLVEPDWRPHLDSHIRARERLDTATRFASFKMASGFGSPQSEMGSLYDHDNEEDFWFERFTQSTAAAGRDWDWRKRRARLQRAAAQMAFDQSSLSPQLPGNVGKTDVQLQHEQPAAPVPVPAAQAAAPVRSRLPSAPLITFTEQELQSTSLLKIDTETGRRGASYSADAPRSPGSNGTPLSPTPSGTGTPMGGIFSATAPSAESVSTILAGRMAQRRRASEDASALPLPSDAALKKGVLNRAMRRRVSASADAIPTSTGGSPAASPGAEGPSSPRTSTSQRYSGELSRSSIDIPPSNSVPGRLSSLSGTVGKKVSLTNLRALRRGSGSNNDFESNSAGMELVPHSPELAAEELPDTSLDSTSGEGPRSSADAYSSVPLSRTDSLLRQVEMEREDSRSKRGRGSPHLRGGATMTKQASAPEQVEMLRDWERDSISQGSTNSSDSLRRRMRSQTDPRNSPLSPAVPSTPSPTKTRVRQGSRSSIMRNATGELPRRSSTRSASSPLTDTSSIRSTGSSRRKKEVQPDPILQPEPAPRGMAQRARSASLSSNNSSLSGSRKSSRSNSFRGEGGGLGLSMTASNPGTPSERNRGDPFGMTTLQQEA